MQSRANGLSADEVRQRLERHGPNTLPQESRNPLWRVFLHQFQSPLIYILFAAAVLAFALGKHEDSWVILIVVLVNAIIGAFQEGRAERSMESLRKLSALRVRVLRDGGEQSIEAAGLVPGDVMLLAAGDAVAADARLLDARVLEVAEAALTGESLPVLKQIEPLPDDTLLADRKNMVYSGTHITAGRGKANVVATGLNTEVGKIASLTASAQAPKTPLELRMEQLGRTLVMAAMFLFVLVIAAGFLRGMPMADILMVSVSQMVSVVPEGLPVALTIALAVGMQRMARRGAIVRTLSAVETLGCTTVICTDKTGTLTKNEMTVTTLAGRRPVSGGFRLRPHARRRSNQGKRACESRIGPGAAPASGSRRAVQRLATRSAGCGGFALARARRSHGSRLAHLGDERRHRALSAPP